MGEGWGQGLGSERFLRIYKDTLLELLWKCNSNVASLHFFQRKKGNVDCYNIIIYKMIAIILSSLRLCNILIRN